MVIDLKNIKISFNRKYKSSDLTFFFLTCLFIIIGLSLFKFSPDYYQYSPLIKSSPNQYDFTRIEPGFWLIVYINDLLFNKNEYTFFIIIETIIITLFAIGVSKYSEYKILSFIVFLFLFYPNLGIIQIRQGIAAGLFFISIEYLKNKQFIKYFICVIFASFFHISAIVLIPLYFIDNKKINKIILILTPLVGLLLYKFIITFNTMNSFAQILPGMIGMKLKEYLVLLLIQGESNPINRINPINLLSFTLLILFVMLIFFSKRLNEYEIICIKLLAISLLCWFSFINIPVLSFRLTNYFNLSIIILFPSLNKFFKQKQLAGILIIIFVFLLSFNVYIFHKLFNILD